jgi:hypothetical protein
MTALLEEQASMNARNAESLQRQISALVAAFGSVKIQDSGSISVSPSDILQPSRSQLSTDNGNKIRHRIEDFPEFDGNREIGKDIHFWITLVESKTSSFTDRFTNDDFRRIIHGRFTGTALEHLHSVGLLFDKCDTWKAMKRFLRSQFADTNYEVLVEAELNSRILLPTEPIGAFYNNWTYLLASVAKLRRLDAEFQQKFIDNHVQRLMQRLPTTIRLQVSVHYDKIIGISDPVERLGRVLLSESTNNFRFYRLMEEYQEFKGSPISALYGDRAKNMAWLNQQLRAQGMPEIRPFVSRPASSMMEDKRSRPRRIAVEKPTAGGRTYKCVCGGAHRYADCPKEIGKAKFREIQARIAKRNQPGVRFVETDNAVYTLDSDEKGIEEFDIIATIDEIPDDEYFRQADHH